MPLSGFKSLCGENECPKQVVSRDKGNPQKHVANNVRLSCLNHYKIDGEVIKEKTSCDFLLLNEDDKKAYFIELKGSNLVKAAQQIEETEKALMSNLQTYDRFYRIIANKCKTQEIRSSEYRKYQMKWKNRLKQTTLTMEENV